VFDRICVLIVGTIPKHRITLSVDQSSQSGINTEIERVIIEKSEMDLF